MGQDSRVDVRYSFLVREKNPLGKSSACTHVTIEYVWASLYNNRYYQDLFNGEKF